jgi:hypothetical protein
VKVNAKCSRIKGKIANALSDFVQNAEVEIILEKMLKVLLADCSLEIVDRFFYLGDMLDTGGGD